jgi:predicted DCC family thiol-disulfide oxidoreductase YuxK
VSRDVAAGAGGRVAPGTRPPGGRAWLVLYDDDCGLCKSLLAGLLAWDRATRLRPLALQRAEAEALLADLSGAERMASWHLVSPDGVRWSAGAALAPLLSLLPGGRLPAAVLTRMPRCSERGYRLIADHRGGLSRWLPGRLVRRATARVHRREHGES